MAVSDFVMEAPASRRPNDLEETVDIHECSEQQDAIAPRQPSSRRSLTVAMILLVCMFGVAMVAAAGIDATERPRPEAELLSKADAALQGNNGKLHALALSLTKRNKALSERRAVPEDKMAHLLEAQRHAITRSVNKLASAPITMTRGKMLQEEPPAEAPAADPAADPAAADPAPAQPEGIIKNDGSDDAMASEIGNLHPTGIMGVFFSGHTFMIAIGVIITLITLICLFAHFGDCDLTPG